MFVISARQGGGEGYREKMAPPGRSPISKAGSFFGEMGLAGEPRSADVVALGELECWEIANR